MFDLNITEAELKQIEYNDSAIKNMKTKEQKRIIEKKEYDKRLRLREKAMLQSLEKVRNTPKYTFINHLTRFVEEKDITPTMKSREVEDGFNYLI